MDQRPNESRCDQNKNLTKIKKNLYLFYRDQKLFNEAFLFLYNGVVYDVSATNERKEKYLLKWLLKSTVTSQGLAWKPVCGYLAFWDKFCFIIFYSTSVYFDSFSFITSLFINPKITLILLLFLFSFYWWKRKCGFYHWRGLGTLQTRWKQRRELTINLPKRRKNSK